MQGAPAPHQKVPVFPGCHVGYSLLLEGASIRFGQQRWRLSAIPILVRPRLSGVSSQAGHNSALKRPYSASFGSTSVTGSAACKRLISAWY